MLVKHLSKTAAVLTLAALSLTLSSCSEFPADPDGTLDRVRGGTLRVGVSHSPPYIDVRGDEPAGSEAELVREFAAGLGAGVQWTDGGEEFLMDSLHRGELDLVVGGLTDAAPWTDKAALTRPYAEIPDSRGEPRKHVLAAPLGENAFLSVLEEFLEREAAP